MGDTTNFQIIIYSAPKKQHQKILEILEAHELALDWDHQDFAELELRTVYGTNLGHSGEADEIAEELIGVCPTIRLLAWSDPVYEYLGTLVLYTKRLGLYSHSCDADGTPQLDAAEIITLLEALAAERPEATIKDATSVIAKAAGEPWFDALR